ncbi:hypothetical protein ACFLWA_03705 [Chloroflexota bacterium]
MTNEGAETCPVCYADNVDLEGEGVEIEGTKARQLMSCNTCGSQWITTYLLLRRTVTFVGRDPCAEPFPEDHPRIYNMPTES